MSLPRGKFIVLEGINGCGKGTHLFKISKYIYELNKSNTVYNFREPSGFDENGKKAREMLSADGNAFDNAFEAVGYFAKNRQTNNNIYSPLLEKGATVISDRYWHSNLAFQHAQGIDYNAIVWANQGLLVPDLTLIFDITTDEMEKRLMLRDKTDRRKFDRDKNFMEKVRENYLELPSLLPSSSLKDNSVQIIDGMGSISDVSDRVFSSIENLYKIH